MPGSPEALSRVPAAAIQAFMTDAFCACGLPAADAGITAGAMLDADLSGSDAHGIFLGHTFIITPDGHECVDTFPLEIAVAKC